MRAVIQLREYEDWVGELGQEDAEYILYRLSRCITIQRAVLTDRYILNPKQFVGVITLPSGRRLESQPKVPVRNLFYMLAVAFDLPAPFREELAQFEGLDEILEFVASYFAGLGERRIDQGLYRSYIEKEENLGTVRGSVRFTEDVRQNYVLRHRTYCRYTDFTWNIPENQIIRQVVHLLSGWQFGKALRQRLHTIDMTLSEITPTNYSAGIIDTFQYHRLNEDYRQLHQLCRLFLEGASLTEQVGPFDFMTFLIDMNKLFELFVTRVLQNKAPDTVDVLSQVPLFLGENKQVPIRPDLVLRRGRTVLLAADCKYKRVEKGGFKQQDVYQLLAYCTAMGIARGLLIYPAQAAVVQDQVRIRNSDINIRQHPIDLGKEGKELVRECDRFAHDVVAWADNAQLS